MAVVDIVVGYHFRADASPQIAMVFTKIWVCIPRLIFVGFP